MPFPTKGCGVFSATCSNTPNIKHGIRNKATDYSL
nr:MAG TPA: hypothetical protein [Caudoviricetes sp.]